MHALLLLVHCVFVTFSILMYTMYAGNIYVCVCVCIICREYIRTFFWSFFFLNSACQLDILASLMWEIDLNKFKWFYTIRKVCKVGPVVLLRNFHIFCWCDVCVTSYITCQSYIIYHRKITIDQSESNILESNEDAIKKYIYPIS